MARRSSRQRWLPSPMATGGDRQLVTVSPAIQAHEERKRLADHRREERRGQKAKATIARKARAVAPQPVKYPDLAEAWSTIPWLQQCEVCGENPATERHHVVKEQTLEHFAYSYGYDFEIVRWDRRNRLLVCACCHEPHTQASKRIHISKLRPDTFEFINEYGFGWALEREYDHSLEVV